MLQFKMRWPLNGLPYEFVIKKTVDAGWHITAECLIPKDEGGDLLEGVQDCIWSDFVEMCTYRNGLVYNTLEYSLKEEEGESKQEAALFLNDLKAEMALSLL